MSSDEVFNVLVMAAVYLGAPLFIFLQAMQARATRGAVKRGDDLHAIARALDGEVTHDPSFDGPVVRFQTEGIATYCRQWLLFEGRSDIVTTFECRAGFHGFFEATSQRALRYPSRSARFMMLRKMAGFQIVTTDPAWAEALLAAGLQPLLAQLGSLGRRSRIQLTADRFLVEFEARLSPTEAVEAARIIARIATLPRAAVSSAGMNFVEEVAVTTHGRCPVCGQSFNHPGVHCGQCKVPHHPDCWNYWGRCAIFGCRGRQAA
jgi:hypothetical protein